MNRKHMLILVGLCMQMGQLVGQQSQPWLPQGDKIQSAWAAEVHPENPLPEYPRPQLVRENWQNLNGLCNYAIRPGKLDARPAHYEGKLLVPFAVESALSGVGRAVGKDSSLWYHRTVTLDNNLRKQRVLLHFGAVDWQCD